MAAPSLGETVPPLVEPVLIERASLSKGGKTLTLELSSVERLPLNVQRCTVEIASRVVKPWSVPQ